MKQCKRSHANNWVQIHAVGWSWRCCWNDWFVYRCVCVCACMYVWLCHSYGLCQPACCDVTHGKHIYHTVAHGEDQTSNIWISRFHAGLTLKSCEWRGLRLLTWNPFRNFGYSRENVFHMYGDYCEYLLEILVVVMGARRQGALAAARHYKSGIPVRGSSHPSWSKETPSPGGVSNVLCSLIKNRE